MNLDDKIVGVLLILYALFGLSSHCYGQQGVDTAGVGKNAPANILSTDVATKYFTAISGKADKYYKQVTSKTIRTLEKLSKLEAKVKTILEKVNPQAAARLFGNNQLTFAVLLQKYKAGYAKAEGYRSTYNEHRDKITTSLKYISQQGQSFDSNTAKKLIDSRHKIAQLNEQLDNTAAIEQFIRERKKQLIQQTAQYLGKCRQLQKINKEAYYFVETISNYKELFNDPRKAESAALNLLQKIPAFEAFMKKNSMLASLFHLPTVGDEGNLQAALAGLQTRAQVNASIQQRVGSANAAGRAQLRSNLENAQSILAQLRGKLTKTGSGNTEEDLPNFKPNTERSKTFLQRLELGTNFQTATANNWFPATANIGVSLGYKLSGRNVIGIGGVYQAGLGRGLDHIRLTHQGLGFRSFIDWKLKGSFWLSGGYEQNFRAQFRRIEELKGRNGWQQSGLIGLSKIISIKTRFFKKTSVKLLWDYLSYRQVPRTQALIFRIGYNF